jgi:hypothetical protein
MDARYGLGPKPPLVDPNLDNPNNFPDPKYPRGNNGTVKPTPEPQPLDEESKSFLDRIRSILPPPELITGPAAAAVAAYNALRLKLTYEHISDSTREELGNLYDWLTSHPAATRPTAPSSDKAAMKPPGKKGAIPVQDEDKDLVIVDESGVPGYTKKTPAKIPRKFTPMPAQDETYREYKADNPDLIRSADIAGVPGLTPAKRKPTENIGKVSPMPGPTGDLKGHIDPKTGKWVSDTYADEPVTPSGPGTNNANEGGYSSSSSSSTPVPGQPNVGAGGAGTNNPPAEKNTFEKAIDTIGSAANSAVDWAATKLGIGAEAAVPQPGNWAEQIQRTDEEAPVEPAAPVLPATDEKEYEQQIQEYGKKKAYFQQQKQGYYEAAGQEAKQRERAEPAELQKGQQDEDDINRDYERTALTSLRPFLADAGADLMDDDEDTDRLKEQNLLMGMTKPPNWPLGNLDNKLWLQNICHDGLLQAPPLFVMPPIYKGGNLTEGAQGFGTYQHVPRRQTWKPTTFTKRMRCK